MINSTSMKRAAVLASMAKGTNTKEEQGERRGPTEPGTVGVAAADPSACQMKNLTFVMKSVAFA
jgi:hypothetical protein